MVGIFALWLPILMAGVAVFITSSVVHMLLPHHRTDHKILPDEDGVMGALRRFDIPPGDYLTPCSHAGMDAMKDPAFVAKAEAGPLLVMTVLPKGSFSEGMGKTMGAWFLYCVLVSFFTAYAAELALAPGAHYMEVFRFTGTVAFGFYALGIWPRSIWYKASWATTLKSTADSFVYGLMTAGVFGWLWPA